MMKTTLTLIAAAVCAFAFAARAQSLDDTRERMKNRREAVAALLATANAGENNAGYLEKLKDVSEGEAKTLAEENADRKAVYAGIAKETGSTEANVGRQRAKQIAERAPAGTMVQDADGKWRKKR